MRPESPNGRGGAFCCKLVCVADVLHSNEGADDDSAWGSLRPGRRLGRYELLLPVARGGMARVWAARQHGQRGFQKLVAIKTILPNLAEEREFERMFLDEARIASGVHHPNVCEIYDLGEEQKILYLAMEWVSGDSLSRVLRPQGKQIEPLDPRIAARIVADACAGAHAAHELRDEDGRALEVVHRDLSPHNVLVSIDGLTKVCDFGVAKALDQLHEQTSAGQLKGKLSYMSPEQMSGGAVDRRSDVFTLGCVLYEATTGVRPFKGERDYAIMQAIMAGDVERPSRIVPGYPPDLERIVLRALGHQPTLRFPTAEAMRNALEELLARGPLVTQAHVAQAVRSRIGDVIDKRKERIKQASSAAEQGAWDPALVDRAPAEQRSGVKQARKDATASEPPPPAAIAAEETDPGEIVRDVPTLPELQASSAAAETTDVGAPPAVLESDLFVPLETPAPFDAVPAGSVVAPPPSHVTPEHEASQPGGSAHYVVAALAGLVMAVLIGGGGWWLWRGQTSQAPAASPPIAVSSRPLTPAVPPALVFETTPPDAVLVVDGRELAADVRTIPRPAAGVTVTVVARARGYEDATVLVDYFTTTPVHLPLRAAPPEAPRPAVSAPQTRPRRSRPSSPSLPENPY